MPEIPILPPWLRRGDTIGLVCPAGPVRDVARLRSGIKVMEEMGFKVQLCGPAHPLDGYLAASDEERAANLHKLWNDEQVKAIVAMRGGFGCLRLVERLDWELFARHPKWLVGFSDVTILLNGLLTRSNLVSIHGPVASSLAASDAPSQESLFALLTGRFEERIKLKGMEVLRGGDGQGQLLGGNLTTLAHLLATPWDLQWEGAIVMIEDTNEPLYRLDRMLTQLAISGKLQRLSGLMLGTFDLGEETTANLRLQEALWVRVLELVGPTFPVWGNVPIGHRQRNLALPVGMEVLMDSSAGILHLVPGSVAQT